MFPATYIQGAAQQWGIVARAAGALRVPNVRVAARLRDALQFPPEGTDRKTLWAAQQMLETRPDRGDLRPGIARLAALFADEIGSGASQISPSLSPLQQIIMRRIQQSGGIPFHQFMRLALYGPGGFYKTFVQIGKEKGGMDRTDQMVMNIPLNPEKWGAGDVRMGPTGIAYDRTDFFTSSDEPNFAKKMGDIILRLAKTFILGPIYLVELGAGFGKWAEGILDHIQKEAPQLYQRLHYYIYEISPHLAAIQRETLKKHDRVKIFRRSALKADMPKENVIIFSNELPDAFPVDLAFFNGDQPHFLQANTDGHYFVPTVAPITEPIHLDYLERHGYLGSNRPLEREHDLAALLAAGIPMNLDMEAWYQRLINQLVRGAVITIDYGFRNPTTLASRRLPVVRTYGRRKLNDHHDPFWRPGELDITSDIDFEILRGIGLVHGAQELYFGPQDMLLGTEDTDGFFALIHGKGLEDFILG